MKPQIEWAVLERAFRGVVVRKGGLGSQEEAEAWLAAIEITDKREAYERLMKTDAVVIHGERYTGFREIAPWQPAAEAVA